MSTLTPPKPLVRHPALEITCHINDVPYRLRPSSLTPGHRTFLLTNLTSSATYRVTIQPKGPRLSCTCPDHQDRGAFCKHMSCIHRLLQAFFTALKDPTTP